MGLPTLYVAPSTGGSGGFAWSLVQDDAVIAEGAGSEPSVQTDRLVLRAIVEGLAANRGDLRVCTASETVRRRLSDLDGKRPKGWKNLDDLLTRLRPLLSGRAVRFESVGRTEPIYKRTRNAARRTRHDAAPADPLEQPSPAVVAWVDGGCRENPGGIGGWGFLLVHRSTRVALERRGAHPVTTNNRMELTAAIEALRSLKGQRVDVEVRTDSRYLRDMCTKWMRAWKYRGWRRATGEPVMNLDLVQELDRLLQLHDVAFTWVRGHSGDPGNEHVDRLATRAMDDLGRGGDGAAERRYVTSPVPA